MPAVGMDNRAAGRAAGFLMGKFVRRPGWVAVLRNAQLRRSHEQGEMGFRSVLRTEFSELEVPDLVSGGDDSGGNHRRVDEMLRECADVVGLCDVGAGNHVVVEAIREHGRSHDIILCGHEPTASTRQYLAEGSMKAAGPQDMKRTAQLTSRHCWHRPNAERSEESRVPVELIMRENTQGHELSRP